MTTTISIDLIHIGERFRKDLGDLDALAASIKKIGLLHPIGIDSKYNLVFGQRRLEACKRLGLTHVPVRVIDIDNPLKAENDENEVRKDFTPSEKIAIGRAIEKLLAGRQGNPTGANQYDSGNPQKIAEFQPQGESRDIAAKTVS